MTRQWKLGWKKADKKTEQKKEWCSSDEAEARAALGLPIRFVSFFGLGSSQKLAVVGFLV